MLVFKYVSMTTDATKSANLKIAEPVDLFACNTESKKYIYIHEIEIENKHVNCFDKYLEVLYKFTLTNGSDAFTKIYLSGEKGCQKLNQESLEHCPLIKRYLKIGGV